MLRVYAHNETNFNHNGLSVLNTATNVKVSREINGDYRLTFNLPIDYGKWSYLKQRNKIVCEGQQFRIYKKGRQKQGTITRDVECLHVISDGNSHIPYFEVQIGKTPREILVAAFNGTQFQVMSEVEVAALGMEWVEDLTDIVEPLSKTTPLEIVKIVIEQIQKGELYIDNYKIALVKRLGKDTGKYCTLSNNLKSLGDTEDSTNIITRLYAYGKDDLPLDNETGYIDSEEGIELFGVVDGYIDYDTVTDHAELMTKAQWEFSSENPYRKDLPDLAYDVTFIELYKLFGNSFKAELGDGLRIKDNVLGIETMQRITKKEWYPSGPQQSNITFGRAPKTYGNMLDSLQGTQSAYNKTTKQNGNIKTSYIENLLKNLQTKVNEVLQKREVVQHKTGDIWVDPNNPDRATLISDGIYAVANSRTVDGDFAWRTIGTADEFVADKVAAEWVYAGLITAEQIDVSGGLITADKINVKGLTVNNGTVDTFVVNEDGNVTLNSITISGDITWTSQSNPVKVKYSVDTNILNAHEIFNPSADKYAFYSYDGGVSWGSAVKIVGTDGVNGTNGSDASVNETNVFNVLTNGGTKFGLFNSTDGKLYINASYINTGTLTGRTVRTAESGTRIELANNNVLNFYYDTYSTPWGFVKMYSTGVFQISPSGAGTLRIGDTGKYIYPFGNWNCSDAYFTNLKDGSGNDYATEDWVEQNFVQNFYSDQQIFLKVNTTDKTLGIYVDGVASGDYVGYVQLG